MMRSHSNTTLERRVNAISPRLLDQGLACSMQMAMEISISTSSMERVINYLFRSMESSNRRVKIAVSVAPIPAWESQLVISMAMEISISSSPITDPIDSTSMTARLGSRNKPFNGVSTSRHSPAQRHLSTSRAMAILTCSSVPISTSMKNSSPPAPVGISRSIVHHPTTLRFPAGYCSMMAVASSPMSVRAAD